MFDINLKNKNDLEIFQNSFSEKICRTAEEAIK